MRPTPIGAIFTDRAKKGGRFHTERLLTFVGWAPPTTSVSVGSAHPQAFRPPLFPDNFYPAIGEAIRSCWIALFLIPFGQFPGETARRGRPC
jgi:hypothetical protein